MEQRKETDAMRQMAVRALDQAVGVLIRERNASTEDEMVVLVRYKTPVKAIQ